MATPTRAVKPTRPANGDRPNSTAPVAPANPAWESAWPAKVCPRSTRKNPTVPASSAATPEPAKAVRMKSYSNMGVVVIVRMTVGIVVAMRLALDVDIASHDEIAVPEAHDVNLRSVEARQHRPRHDLVDRTDHRRARAQIENTVDGVDQRVEFVRAEHDCDFEVVADAPRDLDHALLVRRVERHQRLVQKQQARPAEQRLAQEHLLALAAGEFANRAASEIACADFVERPVDLAPGRLDEPDEAEAPSDRGAGDDVPAGEPRTGDCAAVLRHVADGGIAAGHRP